MSQNKERSFVATMKTNYGNLHIPKITHGKTTHVKKPDYDTWSFDAIMDVSNYLCVKSDAPFQQLKFYFYCIDDYYSIYLFTDSLYHRYALSNEDKDFIGAFRPDSAQTTYNLLDQNGRIITLDQIGNGNPTLRIQTRGGRTLSVRGNTPVGGLVCTGIVRAKPLDFKFEILSRGAA
ncbi:hypothetical protein BLL42_08835 [Pseudomonas frederiksbergensis]|uniref:Uncharacterized protein n=1 Tax=Pseudomonas frederiksbergensis TaxID=104087 RepID=A0A1J0EIF6_9PSED|nr:hypothetical protein [Pseudomonas frederiksbergensis]APC15833.1 hypothetical protein BLL42_08835 [Pseudomonas frederiksbergensis]